MHKKSADKLHMSNGNIVSLIGAIVFCRKSNMGIGNQFDSGIAQISDTALHKKMKQSQNWLKKILEDSGKCQWKELR